MREPLLLPLCAVLTGVWLARILSFTVPEAVWPSVALFLLAWPASGRLRAVCVLIALVFSGALTAAWHRTGPPPRIDAGSRETVVLEGCVVAPSVFAADRAQFTVELAPGARARIHDYFEDALPARLAYGQRVEFAARIRRPHNFNNPGSFDYAGYLARQNIFWTASVARGSQVRVLPGHCGSRAMAAIAGARAAALRRIEALYPGDDYTAAMMQAILLGESAQLEKVWTENFRRTGTFHALVISGAHVAVLVGLTLLLLRGCGVPQVPALLIATFAAWCYALVSGFTPPVVRAAAGLTLFLVTRFCFRRVRVLNLLAAVAIVYIFCDPGAMYDASFQLSFLCVAVLGALSAPLLERTSAPLVLGMRNINSTDGDPHLEPQLAQFRVELWLLAQTAALAARLPVGWAATALAAAGRLALFVWDSLLVSCVIQVGLALPMAIYFHRFSFTGLSANLVVVPALEAAVPIGFLAIFTGWKLPAAISGWLLRIAAATADWHARWEPAWRVADPPFWLAVGLVVSLAAFAVTLRLRRWHLSAAAAVAALFLVLLLQPWAPAVAKGYLEMTAIDVGQGDSLLVAFPGGTTMVIDGGGVLQYGAARQRRPRLDTGEDVISPYLWSRGIRRLDIVVATHAHEDHTGGLFALLENFRPRELWVGANPSAALVAQAAAMKIPVIAPRAARAPSAALDYSGARIEVVSPPEDYRAARAGNNDSLALRITYGRHSFLLTGDLESALERRLLASGAVSHSDVLKVGHHGSRTSTSQAFLDAVSPSVAVISAGFDNSFGHPHAEVLRRFDERHTATLRTDRDGLVTVRSDGHKLWLDTALWGTAAPADRFNWALSFGRE